MTGRTGELLSRLGLATALLSYSLRAGALSPSTVSQNLSAPTPPMWAASDAVTIASPGDVDVRGYAHAAFAEIKVTKVILGQFDDLASDIAFATYLADVERAITTFENEGTPVALWRLAGQLQSARSELQNRVATVPAWLAVMRCVEDHSSRYLSLPARFHSRNSAKISYEQAPSPSDIAQVFEFDGIFPA